MPVLSLNRIKFISEEWRVISNLLSVLSPKLEVFIDGFACFRCYKCNIPFRVFVKMLADGVV
jgi:hypothetical protein